VTHIHPEAAEYAAVAADLERAAGYEPSPCMHLDDAGTICRGCCEEIDCYGNTESVFRYCSFPDCGCDGERLCMAGNANENARDSNVEGMWSGKTQKQRTAVAILVLAVAKGLV
jgi:hypothetical protein